MTRPETCSTCGLQVRYGYRESGLGRASTCSVGYYHQDEADHDPTFGAVVRDWDAIETRMLERLAEGGRSTSAKGDTVVEEAEETEDFGGVVEQSWIELEPPFDEGVAGGAKQMYGAVQKAEGWSARLWYGRANWKGKSVSEMHRMEIRKGARGAIAWWRDGKYLTAVGTGYDTMMKSTDLKEMMKT